MTVTPFRRDCRLVTMVASIGRGYMPHKTCEALEADGLCFKVVMTILVNVLIADLLLCA